MINDIYLPSEFDLKKWGNKLMHALLPFCNEKGLVIYLNGELGAGKTFLSRAMIQSLGFEGRVKSPTYTLVEEYVLPQLSVYHFDLYRLADPEELEFMGIRDYFQPKTLCLIEWASQGEGFLPPADLTVQLRYVDDARAMSLQAHSTRGEVILQKLNEAKCTF